ncbi:MAG: mechanosensitive ion channel family protein [Nocardioidaceae bacterium]|nr:mechanosensitive ion channel family protein [Nocardioidaceae bacterium]MCL2613350.1 mechanosensitive ion channel family protein [Nocardioidaceae bacterium]
MQFLPLTSPCVGGQLICDLSYRTTGSSEFAKWSNVVIGKPLAIIGLVLLGAVIRWILHRAVSRIAHRAEKGVLPDRGDSLIAARRKQRAATMEGVLNSVITLVIIAVIGTMVLSELGVNIAPIIASAGIIGIALGFGAQSMVKDFLSGIFLFIEDQYGVGDVVDVGEASGIVEAVTLRMTRLRDTNGTVWYVPNGAILRVGNMSQNWSRAVVDVQVGPDADLVQAQKILREVAHDMWEDDDYKGIIIEEPEVTGVETMDMDAITVRVMAKTAPLRQWAVARTLRQRIKARLDYEGISMPFTQRVVWRRGEEYPDDIESSGAAAGQPADGPADSPADHPADHPAETPSAAGEG